MDLAAMYAYTVYESGSFSRAAKELYISQPALSAMIAKLERKLGFRIFERSRGGIVSLTAEGRIYLDMLEAVQECEETMKKRLERLKRPAETVLRVGCMMFTARFLIPETVKRFGKLEPDVPVYLNRGHVGPHGVLHDKLARGELDLLLSYRVEGTRFDSMPLLQERFVIVLHRSLPGAEALAPFALTREQVLDPQTPKTVVDDLSLFDRIPFILYGTSPSSLTSLLGNHYTLSPYSVTDIRNADMQYCMVKQGLGACVAQDMHLSDPMFDDNDLFYVFPGAKKPQRTLYLLWRKGEPLSSTARLFADVLVQRCRELT